MSASCDRQNLINSDANAAAAAGSAGISRGSTTA
jgi:hypothetical protein